MDKAFELNNLAMHFGDVTALDGVTLSADKGQIFGLLGPNGAGKTTIVRILSTLITPSAGTARVLGVDVVKHSQSVRELIGLAGQFAAVDSYLTGYENVYMVGLLYGLSRQESKRRTLALLDRLGLAEASHRPVGTYSGGMRRRLDLGSSLVGEPKVLFLDEPTTGLDPKTRLELWNIIRDLVAGGASILLTTQYLEEADELADMIAVVNHGRVIAKGTSTELKSHFGGDVIEFRLAKRSDQPAVLKLAQKVANHTVTIDADSLAVRVPVEDGSRGLFALVRELTNAHTAVTALSLRRPSLDDVFLSLIDEGPGTSADATNKSAERGA